MKRKANDIYLPLKATIAEIIDMTPDIKLFRIKPAVEFRYEPGQFVMFSLWGAGEVPISITSNYGLHENAETGSAQVIELCIRRVGYVTSAIHLLKPFSEIGIRGPFGNTFPIKNARGRDILFIAGGLGIAPLRPLITKVINEKGDFKRIALVYGSRNPSEVLFIDDIEAWQKMGMHVILTVDKGNEGWKGEIGLVTKYINKANVSFKDACAFVCGPPQMLDVAMKELSLMGVNEDNIFTSLEAHMKCGVGKCGHCYANGKYLCTDGPVFSHGEIRKYNLYSP